MASAYQEKQKIDAVKVALRKLMTGSYYTRAQLFGNSETNFDRNWQSRIMKRLRDLKLVRFEGASTGPSVFYKAVSVEDIKTALDSDEDVVDIIWPSARANIEEPSVAEEAEWPPRQPPQASEEANGQESVEEPGTSLRPSEETTEILGQLLRLTAANVENLIYIRTKIDRIEKRLDEIEKLWK